MSETKLRRDICLNMSAYGHFSKIESHATATGFPDIDFCITMGEHGQIECKHQTDKKNLEIKPSQYRWFKQRLKAGGNIWLLAEFDIKAGHFFVLVDGYHIEYLTADYESWIKVSRKVWHDEINWCELKSELIT